MHKKVIGIDISKLTFDVAFQKQGKWKHYSFPNDIKGFKTLVKLLGSEDHCVMEASGPYYLQLAEFLHKSNIKVSVVNPLVIKRFSQMRLTRAKTDKKDAQVIASYAVKEQPKLWEPSGKATRKMLQINALLESIQKQRTAISNQLEAFISSGMIDIQVKSSLKSILRQLDKEQVKLENQLKAIVNEHYREDYQRLINIPGIGPKSAVMLIALTDNFRKFSNYKQLIAYVGFSPRIYQSGTSVNGKGHICKMGKSQARKVLYMAALSAKRYNKACKEMDERLQAKGKAQKVIIIALANKLLKQAFAIAKSQSQYEKNYIPNPCF